MKSWSEIESSPEFAAAPSSVKREVRGFYRAHLRSSPDFQALPKDEQESVLRVIEGDGDFAIKAAAALVVSAQREMLGREIVDPEKDNAIVTILKGAKAAEHYLDVPLKDRQHESFQDEIPGHLDKPLRALIGFMEDATPEYAAFKFWELRKNMPLQEKIRDVLILSSTLPPWPVNLPDAIAGHRLIRSYSDLAARTSPALPDIRLIPVQDRDQFIMKDPEAALKLGLPQREWTIIDLRVLKNIHLAMAGLQNGLPHGLNPSTVMTFAAEVRNLSYELLARRLYATPRGNGMVPLDADQIATFVIAAGVLTAGMTAVADDYPALFSVTAGMAQIPNAALGRVKTMLMYMRFPLNVEALLSGVETGRVSFMRLGQLEDLIFEESARDAGAPMQMVPRVAQDARTACRQPVLAALTYRTEVLARQAYKKKQQEIRQKIMAEAQRQLKNPPVIASTPTKSPQEPDGPFLTHEDGVAALVIPEWMAFLDPEPENPDSPPSDQAGQPSTVEHASSPSTSTATQQTKAQTASDPPESKEGAEIVAANPRPLHEYLAAHPISIKDLLHHGLWGDFKAYTDILAKTGGASVDETLAAVAKVGLMPEKSSPIDILNALDQEAAGKTKDSAFAPAIRAVANPDLTDIVPAYRDPRSGKVYSGGADPAAVAYHIADAKIRRAALKAAREQTEDDGFLVKGEFLTRAQAEERYGFRDAKELDALKAVSREAKGGH